MKTLLHFIALIPLLPFAALECPVGRIRCGSLCATPCDGHVECPDRSDETFLLCAKHVCNVTDTESGMVGSDDFLGIPIVRFKCQYGGCISDTFKCNGSPDCWDGSDETSQLCSSKKCTRRQFRCTYGACIRRLYACNGKKDCTDQSDETEELCKAESCRSSQFKCRYGACIPKDKRCDGVPNCIDNSDESQEECGAEHKTEPPTSPPTVTSPTPPVHVVTPAQTPPTPPSQPGGPGIVYPVTESPAIDWCGEQSVCSCPEPNQHFCVPCNSTERCSSLGEGAVCSIKPAEGSYSKVTVEVLSCGIRPEWSLVGFQRNHRIPYCGSSEGVPAESVVLANCWGTDILAQCHADGTWHPYQGFSASLTPSPTLCQFQDINSPVCGQRPRFVRAPGRTIHLRAQPQWPWIVGLKQDGKYFCTATIINPHYLITAAHCVTRTQETSNQVLNPIDVKVQRVNVQGKINKDDRISQIHIHPKYNGGRRVSHDVALVRMAKEIIFSHQVYPACVLKEHFPAQEVAATFNRTINEYKWELLLQRHDPRCHSPHDLCATSLGLDAQQFCAINIVSDRYLPKGSSGGPYLINAGSDVDERWTVAGLVSSSYQQTSCQHPFTIFTFLKDYWSWIFECVQNGICN